MKSLSRWNSTNFDVLDDNRSRSDLSDSCRVGLITSVGGSEEWQGVARGLLDAFVAPAFAAHGDVAVVAADLNLVAFFHEVAVGVDAGVDDGLVAACAGRFDFVDGVGNLEEAAGAFEEV